MITKYFKSSLLHSAGIYTVSTILNTAVPSFFLLPVLTRYLPPFEMGLVGTFQVLVSFITPFTGLNVQGAITREYYDKDKNEMSVYITNAIFILILSTALVLSIFLIFSSPISRISVFPVEWLWCIVFVSFSQYLVQIPLALWQVQVKPIRYGAFQISQTVLFVLLALYFVVIRKAGWQGYLLTYIYTRGLYAVFSFIILIRAGWIKIKFNKNYIKDALKFGIPLIPHTLSGTLRVPTDRIMINNFAGLTASGLYVVGFNMASLITQFEVAFNNAWVPWFYKNLKLNKLVTKLKIVKFTYLYVAGAILFAIVFALFIPWFMDFFLGKDYNKASSFIMLLSLARGIDALYFMTCNYLFYIKKTAYIMAVTFSTSLLHILLSYFLIKNHGAIGAAQTTLISSSIIALMIWFFAAKKFKMPWLLQKEKQTV
jgi:O-antigen/teichoic acid export membrane protein